MDKTLQWIYDDMNVLATVWKELSGSTQEMIAEGMAGKLDYVFCWIMENIVKTNEDIDDLLATINSKASK